MAKINVVEEFTNIPGGRTREDGPFSGQEFFEEYLLPRFIESMKKNEKLTIEMDGGYGYGSSFLEEAFGNLVRELYGKYDEIWENLIIISNDDLSNLEQIKKYIDDAIIEKEGEIKNERKK